MESRLSRRYRSPLNTGTMIDTSGALEPGALTILLQVNVRWRACPRRSRRTSRGCNRSFCTRRAGRLAQGAPAARTRISCPGRRIITNVLVVPVRGISLHDVAEDREATDLDHRFRSDPRLFREPCPLAAGKNNRPHIEVPTASILVNVRGPVTKRTARTRSVRRDRVKRFPERRVRRQSRPVRTS